MEQVVRIADPTEDQRSTACPDLQRVSECLENALQAFAQGDSQRACECLRQANRVFEMFGEQPASRGDGLSRLEGSPPQQLKKPDEAPSTYAAVA